MIGAITLEARTRARKVIGIYEGFQWLMQGDGNHVRELEHADVSRVHFQGGSILNTSRANPTKKAEDLKRVVESLDKLGIGYLATIGGDDTMYAASEVAKAAGGRIRVCHVPKTIDNDLPLPGQTPTFGFETARQLGSDLVQNPMEDSRTTGRWYFVVVMGRSAGHLALGIGKSTGATLTLIPEEFPGPIRMSTVCDLLEGAMLKRQALWNRSDGVAVIAEGLLEHMAPEELQGIEGVRIARDSYGHLRLAEVDLAYILKTLVEHRFASRDVTVAVVHKNIGYELARRPPSRLTANTSAPLAMALWSSCLTQVQRRPRLAALWFVWSTANSNTSISPNCRIPRPARPASARWTSTRHHTGSRAST